jgi:hypothetical protein
MGFQVSPGVQVNEIDLTNVIPAVSTSIGGYAGAFSWGPAGELITVSSEKDLAYYYGTPNASNVKSFLTAGSFLKYGNALLVSRAIASDAKNAVGYLTGGSAPAADLIKNQADYDTNVASLHGSFAARCPSSIGDSIKVFVVTKGCTVPSPYTFTPAGDLINVPGYTIADITAQFDYVPTTADEIHILIIDAYGFITGTAGTVLETWTGLSCYTDAKKADGTNNYYKEVLRNFSSYIWGVELATAIPGADVASTTPMSNPAVAPALQFDFDGGLDGTLADGDTTDALDLFADAATVDVNLLFTSEAADTAGTIENYVIEIVTGRKDCVAFISAPLSVSQETNDADRLSAVTSKASALTTRNSYFVLDSTPLYVYNKYQDNYIWIPAAGHMAGLCANTDTVAEPWFSPAGYTRGQLLGVTKLAFNPNQASRDTLYKLGVNSICAFPGQGIVLYGDKTAQAKPSAFDRINVRRLFIVLEKAIATAAKYQLFELNDEFTRAMFRNMVEPFLRDVKGRRGVTDFLVVCDETNNTPEVIDSNRFVADIYIKPARSINFITLNFIATRTGVNFSELVGK